MVPAALSVMIGWLYVDAFVLKGANLIVKRATPLRYARVLGLPYARLRVYGLILAAPYWANAYLLCRAAEFLWRKRRGSSSHHYALVEARLRALRRRTTSTARSLSGRSSASKSSRWPAVVRENTACSSSGRPLRLPAYTCTKSFGKAIEGRSGPSCTRS